MKYLGEFVSEVKNGKVKIDFEDANNKNENPLKVSETIVIDYPENICFSSIIALEDYRPATEVTANTKNGYDIIPMIMPYYPESISRLTFYAEIYNTKKILGENEKYLLNTYLKTFESNTRIDNYFFTKRMNVKDTEVIINTIDINQSSSRLDGYDIRRCAVENNVTIFTALETVSVLLDVLEEITLGVSTIDAE